MELPVLNFPRQYKFQIQKKNSSWYIFDEVRKKWLILTPEEWVRQHVLHYFKIDKEIAASALIVEKKIELNRQIKRLDVLVMKKDKPFLLVECKAPEIKLTQEVFEQSARYNSLLQAPYVLLTNGLQHVYLEHNIIKNEYLPIQELKVKF